MADFSGKIVDAHYMSQDYSVIRVRYEEDGKLYVYNLNHDPDHQDWKDLVAEGWDDEKLAESTKEYKRASAAAHNYEVNQAAKLLLKEKFGYEEQSEKKNTEFSWDRFFDKMNTNKDEIFKFKIWAFESERMKDATAQMKKDLRKTKTIAEAIAVYESVI